MIVCPETRRSAHYRIVTDAVTRKSHLARTSSDALYDDGSNSEMGGLRFTSSDNL